MIIECVLLADNIPKPNNFRIISEHRTAVWQQIYLNDRVKVLANIFQMGIGDINVL